MTLQERIATLEEEQKYALAIELLELALPIWEDYAKHPDTDLDYLISPFHGLGQVHPSIVRKAIDVTLQLLASRSTEKTEAFQKEIDRLLADYTEHIMGANNWELELDYLPELVFFSAYNLLEYTREKINPYQESNIYVSCNKSIDALTKAKVLSWDAARALLEKYV